MQTIISLLLVITAGYFFVFAKKEDFIAKTHFTKVDAQNFSQFIGTKDKLVIIEFNAKWCPSCRKMALVLDNLSQTHAANTVFGSVDIDDNPDKANEYNVTAIPAVLFFKDGKLKGRLVGLTAKSDLEQLIRQQQ